MNRAPSPTYHLDLVVGHLNASAGTLVSAANLAQALRDGTVSGIDAGSATPQVQAVLLTLFVETDPQLLGACIRESGASWKSADRLYRESLADHMPRVAAWERWVASHAARE